MEGISHASTFKDIYLKSEWGIGSGGGSNPEFCAPFVDWLQSYIRSHSISSMVDIGCGDLQWIPTLVKHTGIQYTGIDCVSTLIETHSERYPDMKFISSDIFHSVNILPDADLYLIKDVVQHWPTADIREFIAILKRKSKPGSFILLCNCEGGGRESRDIKVGEFLALSSRLPPLNEIPHETVYSWNNKFVIRLIN